MDFNKSNIDQLNYKYPKIVSKYHELFDDMEFDPGISRAFLSSLYLYGVNGEDIVCRALLQQLQNYNKERNSVSTL